MDKLENVIHRLTLDLTKPDTMPRVEVQQDNARSLAISLTQGGRPYWIAEGVTAVFSARKPDGKPLFNGCTIEKNRVVYDFTDQTTNVAGIVECEILLYSGDERILASPRFELAIDELIHKDGDVPESSAEISALTQMVAAGTAMIEDLREALGELEGVEEILTKARAAAEAASGSEAAARGHAKTAADAAEDALTLAGQVNSAVQQANKYAFEADQSAKSAAAERETAENAVADALGYAEDAESQAVAAGNHAKAAEEAAARAEAAAENAGGGSAGDINDAITDHNTDLAAHAPMQDNLNALRDKAISEAIGSHGTDSTTHADIRTSLESLRNKVNILLNSDDVTLDQTKEIVAYIKSNKALIDAITTSKVSVADIVDNFTTDATDKPLSARMGLVLKNLLDLHETRYDERCDNIEAGKLDASKLPEAINTALAQAQASGAFDGADGIGISGAEINENGELVITYSNDETVNLGRVVGEGSGGAGNPGKDGVGISKTEINGEGHLIITYTDGKTADLGNVIGAPGADGSAATIAIVSVAGLPSGSPPSITEAANSTAQNRKYLLGIPRGEQGPAGADGKDGADGADGQPGKDGISPVVAVSAITGGNRITITDKNGTNTVDVMHGKNGSDGKDGADGSPGKDGATGPQGPKGDTGETGQQGPKGDAGDSGVHILADGETLDDVPPGASVVIDPRGDGFGTQVFTFTLTDGSVVEMEVVARVV